MVERRIEFTTTHYAMNTYEEKPLSCISGWAVLPLILAGIATSLFLIIRYENPLFVLGIPVLGFVLKGLFIVMPNQARVLVLFGRYRGSVREEGFYWTNPFTSKQRVSVRVHNFNSEQLKVNDLLGNPIEIAAVVVWRVKDTAKAAFEVEDYDDFVQVQSEAAVRSLASAHPYDEGLREDDKETTLRGSAQEVADELEAALQRRLDDAGIQVVEARLSHLAYAPEIASAMLQRQQAAAVIAARQKIVEGAVGMVEGALHMLDKNEVTHLDEERKAALVGNLLVVLCGGQAPTPVLNTGTLYN